MHSSTFTSAYQTFSRERRDACARSALRRRVSVLLCSCSTGAAAFAVRRLARRDSAALTQREEASHSRGRLRGLALAVARTAGAYVVFALTRNGARVALLSAQRRICARQRRIHLTWLRRRHGWRVRLAAGLCHETGRHRQQRMHRRPRHVAMKGRIRRHCVARACRQRCTDSHCAWRCVSELCGDSSSSAVRVGTAADSSIAAPSQNCSALFAHAAGEPHGGPLCSPSAAWRAAAACGGAAPGWRHARRVPARRVRAQRANVRARVSACTPCRALP